MKYNILPYAWLLAATVFAGTVACGGSEKPAQDAASGWSADQAAADPAAPTVQAPAAAPASVLITKADLKLGAIDAGEATKGKGMYELKCQSCHSLGDNRVVGPGWKGLTTKREPEWIMNMVVHTEAMLEKDPEAQKMLEECLVRMPNQSLSVEEARQVLEFMRSNDKS